MLLIVVCHFCYATLAQGPCPGVPTVTYEGKTYNTVQIGTQCWLKENLDVGEMIKSSQRQLANSKIEKYCYDDNPDNCNKYGGLYTWFEAMQWSGKEGAQGICPPGWHIPTFGEFTQLDDYVNNNGNDLTEIGQGTGLYAGTNSSGFSALYSGSRGESGFVQEGRLALFWCSSMFDENRIWAAGATISMYIFIKEYAGYARRYGWSIRCIKD